MTSDPKHFQQTPCCLEDASYINLDINISNPCTSQREITP